MIDGWVYVIGGLVALFVAALAFFLVREEKAAGGKNWIYSVGGAAVLFVIALSLFGMFYESPF